MTRPALQDCSGPGPVQLAGEGGLLVRISSCQLSAIVSCWPDDTGDHINWSIGGGAGLMAQDGGVQSWSNTFISHNLSSVYYTGVGGSGWTWCMSGPDMRCR